MVNIASMGTHLPLGFLNCGPHAVGMLGSPEGMPSGIAGIHKAAGLLVPLLWGGSDDNS